MGYVIGLVVIVGGALLLRKYLYSRPIRFKFEGATYVRQPDGSFTSIEGAPVVSPQLEKVKAHWEKMNSSDNDWGSALDND